MLSTAHIGAAFSGIKETDKMKNILLACILALLFASCGTEVLKSDDGNMDPDGDLLIDGDKDLDIDSNEEDDLVPFEAEIDVEKSINLAATFSIVNVSYRTKLIKAVWFDENETVIQTHNGSIPLNSYENRISFEIEDVPSNFSQVELIFDTVFIRGGGDVSGKELEVSIRGGGDVSGIYIPRLLIERVGGDWQIVTMQTELASSFDLNDHSNYNRAEVAVELIKHFEVLEKGLIVGMVNYTSADGDTDVDIDGDVDVDQEVDIELDEEIDDGTVSCDLPNGSDCDDHNNCTDNDSCNNGICSGSTYSCNDHGDCNSQNDICSCITGYVGDYCDTCDDGYIGYPDCQKAGTPDFVTINAGSFWMGSPDGNCPNEYAGSCANEIGRDVNEPLHHVNIASDFEIMRNEVLQGEFTELMGWNPSSFISCGSNCPVEQISWFDALAYSNKKSESLGLPSCYILEQVECDNGTIAGDNYMECFGSNGGISSAVVTLSVGLSDIIDCLGYRLPTESEWEYAARAGSLTAYYKTEGSDGTNSQTGKTPLDENLDLVGWYGGNCSVDYEGADSCTGWFDGASSCGTNQSGKKAPNAWGLHDMTGNVWEWMSNAHYFYPGDENYSYGDGCSDTSTCKIFRGCSWGSIAEYCRIADRGMRSPDHQSKYLGMRLARTLPE